MVNLTLVQSINLALAQEMEADDSVVLLGEDIGINGGVFRGASSKPSPTASATTPPPMTHGATATRRNSMPGSPRIR